MVAAVRNQRLKRSRKTETQVVVPTVDRAPAAVRRTRDGWNVAPTAATRDPERAVAGKPRAAVRGCAIVVFIPAILDPFPGIADHVVQAEQVGPIAADPGGVH